MTNSTFIEGYSTDGDLRYAPYRNDARVSHAHGWSSGPTSALTFYAAGLQITSAAGKTWKVAPQLGDLKTAEAGFQTVLGHFSSNVTTIDGPPGSFCVIFETPFGTSGSFAYEYEAGAGGQMTVVSLEEQDLSSVHSSTIPFGQAGTALIHHLPGGRYKATALLNGQGWGRPVAGLQKLLTSLRK
jgi:hypothetical protein